MSDTTLLLEADPKTFRIDPDTGSVTSAGDVTAGGQLSGHTASLADGKAVVASDGEFVTSDDVRAPSGVVFGNTLEMNLQAGTGAPSTGAHNGGEFHADSVGSLFFCTVSGTPGTWVQLATV